MDEFQVAIFMLFQLVMAIIIAGLIVVRHNQVNREQSLKSNNELAYRNMAVSLTKLRLTLEEGKND